MRRCAAISLMLVFLALGTGAFEYVHNHEHLHDHGDADQTNCFLHGMLRAPLLSASWVPLLVCLGLFVAFLTQITSPLLPQRAIFRLDCRGPPAC